MKNSGNIEVVHKDIVIIGNGPSGIALSYMLSGNLPYLISSAHPDELLSTRLKPAMNKCLIHQNLLELAEGLEGRSTNPISLLLDALQHPYADMGMDLEPLIEWRRDGVEIEHIVLGKGPPGGSWHSMDPNILTLSLGSWMSLPGLRYEPKQGDSKSRATAGNVANYYLKYIKEMGIADKFRSNIYITDVRSFKKSDNSAGDNIDKVFGEYCNHDNEDKENTQKNWVTRLECDFMERPKLCTQPGPTSNLDNNSNNSMLAAKRRSCSISNAISSCIRTKGKRKEKLFRCCRKTKELLTKEDQTKNDRKVCDIVDRSLFLTEEKSSLEDTTSFRHLSTQSLQMKEEHNYSLNTKPFFKSLDRVDLDFCELKFLQLHDCYNLNSDLALKQNEPKVPNYNCYQVNVHSKPLWVVEGFNSVTDAKIIYTCNNLVLANGSSDMPNRLSFIVNPDWLLYDLRTLEQELDKCRDNSEPILDPVLIVGAGLSAADAVIATKIRNIPVLHVFRHKSTGLGKQLPENMYPEYHKVHQMMLNNSIEHPQYTALPECELIDIDEDSKTVILMNNVSKVETKYKVSYIVVLIGSKPDLSFLPTSHKIGVNKSNLIDCKSNPVDLNKVNYSVKGNNSLYALGPLAGDNFVRFIPGGALAILSDLYRKNDY